VSLQSPVVVAALHSQAAHAYLTESLTSPQHIAPMPRVCAQLAELTAQHATDAAQLARLIQSDAMGGEYCGGSEISGARFDGFSQVEVQLRGGATLTSDIVFAAFGRVANLDGIGLDSLGLSISSRGTVQVNERFETNIPGIFAAGDAIGPPALACAAADQGRRAALVALGLPPPALTSLVPSGVYTIPEIACVGLSQSEAAAKKIDLIVGRADFSEVARAHIVGEPSGFLTLLCERGSARLLGVQVLGEGATELVHLGQAAIATGATADFFIEQIFNFPTMTEAYRIAAFDILKQRSNVQPASLKVPAPCADPAKDF
jgi:NAD(P) transhydrogenase